MKDKLIRRPCDGANEGKAVLLDPGDRSNVSGSWLVFGDHSLQAIPLTGTHLGAARTPRCPAGRLHWAEPSCAYSNHSEA